jgi:hypothetical protein
MSHAIGGPRAASGADGQLADMHRKYRIMEGNRKNYSEDSQTIIKRQRATIDKLKHENEKISREISGFPGQEGSMLLSVKTQQNITFYQDEADSHGRKIDLERRRLEVGTFTESQISMFGGSNARVVQDVEQSTLCVKTQHGQITAFTAKKRISGLKRRKRHSLRDYRFPARLPKRPVFTHLARVLHFYFF